MGIQELAEANPGIKVLGIDDADFSRYARLLDPGRYAALLELCDRETSIDPLNNKYVASEPKLEVEPYIGRFERLFGDMEIQVGYCNGPNSLLNALEWHKSSEVDIAVTDLVLLLGSRSDVGADGRYDSGKLACFYLPRGSVVELLPETLHYSPCRAVESGFKSVIVLPKGTNEPLGPNAEREEEGPTTGVHTSKIESRLLFMRNKWLIAHPDRKILVDKGAFPGIEGRNIEIVPARR